jgi:sulfur-oxidizing protein SoxZ
MATALIHLPKKIKTNELISIRCSIAHPMETGLRPGADGKVLAANLIRRFTCHFELDGVSSLVFGADLFAAVAANPYLAFSFKASQNGQLRFTWRGDRGFSHSEVMSLTLDV